MTLSSYWQIVVWHNRWYTQITRSITDRTNSLLDTYLHIIDILNMLAILIDYGHVRNIRTVLALKITNYEFDRLQ